MNTEKKSSCCIENWKHYRSHSRQNRTNQEQQNDKEKTYNQEVKRKQNVPKKRNTMLCYPISFRWHISVSFVILLILCVNMDHTRKQI